MHINYYNKEMFKDTFHDYIFSGFTYDYEKRSITLPCSYDDGLIAERKTLAFQNVIYTELQSCSFWRGGNSIYCAYIDDNNEQLTKLYEYQQQKQYTLTKLDKNIQYLTIAIEINSGDKLLIICESIEVSQEMTTQ